MKAISYHCHSTWSDGRASVHEMVNAAAAAGLLEFGLSDHFVLTPYADSNAHEWSMPGNGGSFEACLNELRDAAVGAGITVRYGAEVDYFPETWERVRDILSGFDLDYVIGSVHAVGHFPIDSSPDHWKPLSQQEINTVYRTYWQRLRELAECGLADVIGHLDLPKKFGYRPDCDLTDVQEAVFDALVRAGTAIELNTAGWDKVCGEAYPAPTLLRRACERGIPVVLSADAHAPGEVARHFGRGAALLREAGYHQMLRFEKRHPAAMPLPTDTRL